MKHDQPAYGLWLLVVLNSAVLIMFAYSFFKPATVRDWRTFGSFAAFIVALFVEMYGFPLTFYLFSGWLQTKYPDLDILSHDTGHLWSTLLGEKVIRILVSCILQATSFWPGGSSCCPAPGMCCTTHSASMGWLPPGRMP